MTPTKRYAGELLPSAPTPYVADPGVVEAVNLALDLKRPLLLEGEPGCGKTTLAANVAHELEADYIPWPVRSSGKAEDGLYRYDAILRLHDVHLNQLGSYARRDPADATAYRTFGPMGQAFTADKQAVVLIDEIDKADLDFPNDLLTVLEDRRFHIPYTSETVEARHAPLIIITSNKEKGDLPAPFLRRCVYFYLQFPDTAESLMKIVKAHFPDEPGPQKKKNWIRAAIDRFLEIRAGKLRRKPGTSEFLDWMKMMMVRGVECGETGAVPFPELLFKVREDWQAHKA